MHDGRGASDERTTEIKCQHQRSCHHDEGGAGVGPVRGEERGRYSEYADPGQREDQGRHLRRPGKHREARGRGGRPEARTSHRLEKLRPTVARTKSPQRYQVETPLPRQPDSAHDRPTAPEQQHDRRRLVAIQTDETQGQQAHEAQQREQGRDERVGPDARLPTIINETLPGAPDARHALRRLRRGTRSRASATTTQPPPASSGQIACAEPASRLALRRRCPHRRPLRDCPDDSRCTDWSCGMPVRSGLRSYIPERSIAIKHDQSVVCMICVLHSTKTVRCGTKSTSRTRTRVDRIDQSHRVERVEDIGAHEIRAIAPPDPNSPRPSDQNNRGRWQRGSLSRKRIRT